MNCLNPNCKKEMLKFTALENDAFVQFDIGETKKILHDGKTDFIRCPHCGAKNILGIVPMNEKGPMKYQLTRYEVE